MKRILTLCLCALCTLAIQAQTIDDLKAQKQSLESEYNEAQSVADGLKSKIDALDTEIKKLSGWRTGLNGLVGFDFNNSDNWAANPNPTSSSSALNIGGSMFANRLADKYFWRNKLVINKSWQDVDFAAETEEDGLESTLDILNLSSLYGYKFSEKLAASALGELNTSIENFLSPGTLDIGVGFTWTPVPDLVVVVHPLNYRAAFSGLDAIESTGTLGAKLRADYTRSFNVGGKNVAWSSVLTGFLPYQNNDPDPSLQEYTWINNLAFTLFKGIGVGASFGIRNAEFETTEIQTFYSLGLSYAFEK